MNLTQISNLKKKNQLEVRLKPRKHEVLSLNPSNGGKKSELSYNLE
jgi:hypothetical protein